MLSDSESESSPVKFDNLNLPLAEEIEKKVGFLQNAYPDIDPMVLQDTLKYFFLPWLSVTENFICVEITKNNKFGSIIEDNNFKLIYLLL